MKSIFITGSSGFVGQIIIKYFNTIYDFYSYIKDDKININQEVVLHLAGKAHDLKKISNQVHLPFENSKKQQLYDSIQNVLNKLNI